MSEPRAREDVDCQDDQDQRTADQREGSASPACCERFGGDGGFIGRRFVEVEGDGEKRLVVGILGRQRDGRIRGRERVVARSW